MPSTSSSSSNNCCGRVRLRLTCANGIYTLTGTRPDGTTVSVNSFLTTCSPFLTEFSNVPIDGNCETGVVYVGTGSSFTCPGGSGSSSSASSSGFISTPCCSYVPSTLYASFTNVSGCDCVTGTSIPITWNGTSWVGTGALGTCGHDITVTFTPNPSYPSGFCFNGSVVFDDGCGSTFTFSGANVTSCTTSSFVCSVGNYPIPTACGCGAGGEINITITN